MFNSKFQYNTNWDNLKEILSQPNCSITTLLKESNVISSINYLISEICQFFFDNLEILIDIAVSDTDDSCNARGVLFALPEQFPREISESNIFHNKMNSILSEDPLPKYAAVSIARVILAIGKSQNYSILSNLSENHFFFPKLCKLIHCNAVYETLLYLSSDDHHAVSTFFEDLNAATVLFNLLLDTSSPQQKERILIILSELIRNTDLESTLIVELTDSEHLQQIINISTQNEFNNVRFSALKLLRSIIEKCNQKNESTETSEIEELNFSNVIQQVSSNVDKLCEFVLKEGKFESAVMEAIEIIIFLLKSSQISSLECVINCLNVVLDRFFENASQTKLHITCYKFVDCFLTGSPQNLPKLNLKSRIIQKASSIINKSINYWGFVFKFVEIIQNIEEKEVKENNVEWTNFINGIYNNYSHIINTDYGGERPIVDSYSSTSDEFIPQKKQGLSKDIRNFDIDEIDEIDKIQNKSNKIHGDDDENNEEIRVVTSIQLDDDDELLAETRNTDGKRPQLWSDDDDGADQVTIECQLPELNDFDDDFIIAKPKGGINSPWAKEIIEDLENEENEEDEMHSRSNSSDEDYIIPKKETTESQKNWANFVLQELQKEDVDT